MRNSSFLSLWPTFPFVLLFPDFLRRVRKGEVEGYECSGED